MKQLKLILLGIILLFGFSYSLNAVYIYPVSLTGSLIFTNPEDLVGEYTYLKISTQFDVLKIQNITLQLSKWSSSTVQDCMIMCDEEIISKSGVVGGIGKRFVTNLNLYVQPTMNIGFTTRNSENAKYIELMNYFGYQYTKGNFITFIDLGVGCVVSRTNYYSTYNRLTLDPNIGVGITF